MNKAFSIASVVIKEMYRRKDFYVLLVITGAITLALASINFFNDPNIVRYLKEICLLLIWISSLVICITTAARQIPSERENRTIFPLLAKPVTRWDVVLGKFIGSWLACGIALFVFYVFFAAVSELRGRGESSMPAAAAQITSNAATTEAVEAHNKHDHHGHEEHERHGEEEGTKASSSSIINYFQALWLHWIMLAVLTAMVIFGSVVFTAPSSNATISFIVAVGILYLGAHLHKVAVRLTEPSQTILSMIYFLIPHLEWYDIRERVVYDHPPVLWSAWWLVTIYGIGYTFVFLVGGWFAFRRKSLSV
jgi:ABC-type transport system involved in multi-copper enzyme maturation permease subunit